MARSSSFLDIGIAIGVAFGSAFRNVALGICIGIAVGAAIDFVILEKARPCGSAQKPNP